MFIQFLSFLTSQKLKDHYQYLGSDPFIKITKKIYIYIYVNRLTYIATTVNTRIKEQVD